MSINGILELFRRINLAHKWTEKDDMKALYIYLFGIRDLPFNEHQIAMMIDTTDSSLRMRVENFRNIDTGLGLANFALQSKSIYDRYHKLLETELRKKAFGF